MVPAIRQRAGQTGDFVAMGVSALGLRVHHLDVVGDDPEGDLVRALHRDKGIPFTEVPSPQGTKRAVNLVDPAGRRLSLYDSDRSHEADRLPEETVTALAAVSRHAHVSIPTDLHNWAGVEGYHEAFAYQADLVFLSTTALADTERTMRQALDCGRARVVVATSGAEGAYLLVDDV